MEQRENADLHLDLKKTINDNEDLEGCVIPVWLQNCLDRINDTKIRTRNVSNHCSNDCAILKVAHLKNTQNLLQDCLKGLNKYKRNPTIVYNGNDARIYVPKCKRLDPIIMKGVKYQTTNDGYFILKNTPIMVVMSLISKILLSLGVIKTLFFIGDNKIDRGISITSEDHKFYANIMVYVCSKDATFADHDQSIGRVFGISTDKNNRVCYITPKVLEDMNNGYINNKNIMERSVDNNSSVTSIIREKDISVKLKKVRMCSNFSIRDQNSLSQCLLINDTYDDKDELIQKLQKNITLAMRRNDETIVIKIIRYMKTVEYGTHENIKKNVTTEADMIFDHYTKWHKKSGAYKILVNNNGNYVLNPEINSIVEKF